MVLGLPDYLLVKAESYTHLAGRNRESQGSLTRKSSILVHIFWLAKLVLSENKRISLKDQERSRMI